MLLTGSVDTQSQGACSAAENPLLALEHFSLALQSHAPKET